MNFFENEKILNRILKDYFAKKERKDKYNEKLNFYVPKWGTKEQEQFSKHNYSDLTNSVFWLLLDEFCESKEQKEKIILEILSFSLGLEKKDMVWKKINENTYNNPIDVKGLSEVDNLLYINMDNKKFNKAEFGQGQYVKVYKPSYIFKAHTYYNTGTSMRFKFFWDIHKINTYSKLTFSSKTFKELLLKNNVLDKVPSEHEINSQADWYSEIIEIRNKSILYINEKFNFLNAIKSFETNYHKKAKSYEDLKNMTLKALEKAKSTSFAEIFKKFEIDPNSNLEVIDNLSKEFKKIKPFLLEEFNKDLTLRFRKTDNLKAKGVYFPHVKNITINVNQHKDNDVPHIQSFMHEYAHHIDYELGKKLYEKNITLPFSLINPEFQELKKIYINKFKELERKGEIKNIARGNLKDYLTDHEEIFARGFERYLVKVGFESSFNKSEAFLDDVKEDVFKYLDENTNKRFFDMYEKIFHINEKLEKQKQTQFEEEINTHEEQKIINYKQSKLFEFDENDAQEELSEKEKMHIVIKNNYAEFKKTLTSEKIFKDYLEEINVKKFKDLYIELHNNCKEEGLETEYLKYIPDLTTNLELLNNIKEDNYVKINSEENKINLVSLEVITDEYIQKNLKKPNKQFDELVKQFCDKKETKMELRI